MFNENMVEEVDQETVQVDKAADFRRKTLLQVWIDGNRRTWSVTTSEKRLEQLNKEYVFLQELHDDEWNRVWEEKFGGEARDASEEEIIAVEKEINNPARLAEAMGKKVDNWEKILDGIPLQDGETPLELSPDDRKETELAVDVGRSLVSRFINESHNSSYQET